MPPDSRRRAQLELRLKETVLALRAEHGDGNITLRVPETGDSMLPVKDDEAEALEQMLGGMYRRDGTAS